MQVNQERGQIILSRLGMNGIELQRRLENIQRQVLHDKQQFIVANPTWDILQADARITSLNNIFISLGRTRLGIQFLGELIDDDWFQKNSPESTRESRIDLLVSFEKLIKYSFGMDLFTYIETSFRLFLRALDPTACNNGTDPFVNIYEYLLGSKQLNFPANERTSAKELLNLSRLLRNLIHNSGVYFHKDGLDEIVVYRGDTYSFRHGQPIDFVYWQLLLTLADDIRQLLVKVISHPKIGTIEYIANPYVVRNS